MTKIVIKYKNNNNKTASLRENIMKNKLSVIILTAILGISPLTVNSQTSAAAGGMSVGTAVAIGVVGAALLVALGDSSSSAPAAVAGATPTSSASTSGSSTTAVSQTTTTTTSTSTN